jgi:hyaluronoglucosaminidase
VGWSLRFGLPVRFSSQADRDAVLAKLDALVAEGVDQIVLAFDDTGKGLLPADQGVYASFVDGQIDFLNAVGPAFRARHPDVPLALTPVEYFTHHPDAGTDLRKLAAALPLDWPIAWTGTEVGSTTIDAADAREAALLLGRPPTLGDNYPVSDDARRTGVLHLGPLVGRSADLAGAVDGLLWNAMPLAWASRLGLGTAADYAWNPAAYEPEASLRRVAQALAGEHGGEGLVTLALANRSAMLEGSAAPELQAELEAFWAARAAGTPTDQAGTALQARFGAYVAEQEILGAAPLAPELRAELKEWSDALATYGFLGYAALDLLARADAGAPPADADVSALAAAAEAATAGIPRPTGRLMDDFLARVVAELMD